MLDPNHPIAKLAREDGRYQVGAYTFVFDALNHAHEEMSQGEGGSSDSLDLDSGELESSELDAAEFEAADDEAEDEGQIDEDALFASDADEGDQVERHVSGQQLCTAIRSLALEQYGHMAKCVFNNWGVRGTRDFGNIVFNLISIGQMRKTENDRLEDFDNVFDFDRELVEEFNITLPE